jgi:hypothetical protein
MHLEILVEEKSTEEALKNLVPKMLGPDISFAINVYQGKPDLLSSLPRYLRGYKKWISDDYKIIVLIDEDRKDCKELKKNLEETAKKASLLTKAQAKGTPFQVLNRIAIEELEAWFFGDIQALRKAFPRVPENLNLKASYRNPDAIKGGTRETLERILQRAGYYKSGLPHIETARKISEHMDPARNRSRSFQVFREGLLAMVKQYK